MEGEIALRGLSRGSDARRDVSSSWIEFERKEGDRGREGGGRVGEDWWEGGRGGVSLRGSADLMGLGMMLSASSEGSSVTPVVTGDLMGSSPDRFVRASGVAAMCGPRASSVRFVSS